MNGLPAVAVVVVIVRQSCVMNSLPAVVVVVVVVVNRAV